MRTLAVGDIHGCRNALVAVIEAVKPTGEDRLIFLGDYVDRGPDSKGVIDWILANRDQRETITLRGNHEIMMMDSRLSYFDLTLWLPSGGRATFDSYGVESDRSWTHLVPDEHWAFMEQTTRWFETDSHIYVHAGLDPERDLEEQPEENLYWLKLDSMSQAHKSGKVVVCGHTRQAEGDILNLGYAICIDTAACGGQWLTCLDAESGDYWQANEEGQTRSGKLPPPAV